MNILEDGILNHRHRLRYTFLQGRQVAGAISSKPGLPIAIKDQRH